MIASGLFAKMKRRLSRKPTGRPAPATADFALAVPFDAAAIAYPESRIAVMIHLFHPELAEEMRGFCAAIPAPCDLLITTDSEQKAEAIGASFADWPSGNVSIRIVPNRGRDIAPKLTAFRDEYAGYDLVLFLHSKKSGTVDWGDTWRRQILSSLCGSGQIVASILSLFARDEKLGMVAPKSLERVHEMTRWGDTTDAIMLANRLGLELDFDGQLDFPAGSMFWARPQALKPLLDLGLAAEDFPAEAGQTNATLAHAVERLFYIVCEQAGYAWLKVADPEFFEDQAPLLPIAGASDLDAATAKVARRVSDTMLN